MLPPFCFTLLLLLAVCAKDVLAADNDIDENIAVIVFAFLIVVFGAIALFFLILIVKLKREQRAGDSRIRKQRDIIRINTDRGLVAHKQRREPSRRAVSEDNTNTNPSTLLPISEKGEEDIEIVPSYDKVSNRSSFYERVDGPNPVYQQYHRKGLDSIPINMMKPKTETIENALYDATIVSDMEDQPVIVSATEVSTKVTNDVPPVYAVPDKKSKMSLVSAFSHKCEDSDILPAISTDSGQKLKHDMSIFISKSQTKVDSGAEGDVSASMDNDSDEVFSEKAVTDLVAQQRKHDDLGRTGSLLSTTSEDRDLLNTESKLKGRPKISHPKSKLISSVVTAAKNTKSKQTDWVKTKPLSVDVKAMKQGYEQVKVFTQTKPLQDLKPTIPQKPLVDQKLFHKTSQKLKAVGAHHSNQPGAPPLKLTSTNNPQSSPNSNIVTPSGQAQVSHLMQNSPLAHLRAKSSPRVKPRSAGPAVQKKMVSSQSQQQPKSTTATPPPSKHRQLTPDQAKEIKSSSAATEKLDPRDVTDEAVEKRRHKSENSMLEKDSDHRMSTSSNLSFRELRKQESDEFDQTLKDFEKDFEDFMTTII